MYTKIISLILALGITTSLLASCSDNQSTTETDSDTVSQDQGGVPPSDGSGYMRRPMNGSGAYMNGSGSSRA